MIELQQLTKRYGEKLAVDAISATIQPGVVTGFLGPNGAGKSTTMRMILGLDRPTAGAALVNGRPYVESRLPLPRSARCSTPRASTSSAALGTTSSRWARRLGSDRRAWTRCSHRSG